MRAKRFLLACVVLFLVAMAWNALLHMVLLKEANAAVQHLRRPDFSQKAWLGLVLTAGLVVVFVWGYGRFARDRSLREGLTYGLFFALVAGLLVDLNQYLIYPLPGRLAFEWFVGALVEFSLYGVLVSRLAPPPDR